MNGINRVKSSLQSRRDDTLLTVGFSLRVIALSLAALCTANASGQTVTGVSKTIKTTFVPSVQTSDVDVDIPDTKAKQPNVFALVIGNENYRESAIPVPFANNDADVFKQYLEKTLGIPASNIRLISDATREQMEKGKDWVCDLATTYKGNAEIIFYYAGHGLCDDDKQNYLLPVDVSEAKRGIKLESLYRQFGNLKDVKTTCFIDACFSGKASGGMLVATRSAVIAPNTKPIGNVIVFSATSIKETAHPYKAQKHGIFTYFLLKNLQQTAGNISYKELSDNLKSEVSHNCIKINGNPQTPETLFSQKIGNTWTKWKLK